MAAPSDIAFTPSVKSVQIRKGSRAAYAKLETRGRWETTITPELAAFLAEQDSIYLATASADGQPYIQHRGGPPGFIHALDEHSLAFADFAGNRQFITAGNLAENPKAHLFAMDYVHRRRIKLWGTARVVEDDPGLLARLMPPGYAAKAEQVIIFTVAAWDINCPQHIPQKVNAKDVASTIERLRQRVAELEARLARER